MPDFIVQSAIFTQNVAQVKILDLKIIEPQYSKKIKKLKTSNF